MLPQVCPGGKCTETFFADEFVFHSFLFLVGSGLKGWVRVPNCFAQLISDY